MQAERRPSRFGAPRDDTEGVDDAARHASALARAEAHLMAGRIRTDKPEILDTDEALAGLTDAGFKMYHAIKLSADDAGRVRLNPQQLLTFGWWARPRASWPDPLELLLELRQRKVIRVYDVEGVEYAEIIGWNDKGGPRYQAINKNQGARHPAPADAQTALPFPSSSGSSNGGGPEDDGRATVENSASARTLVDGSATVARPERDLLDPIRTDSNRTDPDAASRAIPPARARGTEPIPVDSNGYVTPDAIRAESARLAQRVRTGGAS